MLVGVEAVHPDDGEERAVAQLRKIRKWRTVAQGVVAPVGCDIFRVGRLAESEFELVVTGREERKKDIIKAVRRRVPDNLRICGEDARIDIAQLIERAQAYDGPWCG